MDLKWVGKSIRQRIMRSHLFQSGEPFTPKGMARDIGARLSGVQGALLYMKDRGEVFTKEGMYQKPSDRHWIHIARLNDPQRLKERHHEACG